MRGRGLLSLSLGLGRVGLPREDRLACRIFVLMTWYEWQVLMCGVRLAIRIQLLNDKQAIVQVARYEHHVVRSHYMVAICGRQSADAAALTFANRKQLGEASPQRSAQAIRQLRCSFVHPRCLWLAVMPLDIQVILWNSSWN
jgi:hypothetical protein